MPPIRRWEVFRPSRATADRAACGRGAPQESAGAGGAPTRRPHPGSALTECAGRGMPPPLAEPARSGGMHGDGLAPDGNRQSGVPCVRLGVRASSAHERHPAWSEYLPAPPAAPVRRYAHPAARARSGPVPRRASAGALVAHVSFCGARSAPLPCAKRVRCLVIAQSILLIFILNDFALVGRIPGVLCISAIQMTHTCSHGALCTNEAFFFP